MKVFFDNAFNVQSFISSIKNSRLLNEIDKKTAIIASVILSALAIILVGVLYYRCKFSKVVPQAKTEEVENKPILPENLPVDAPEQEHLVPVEMIDPTKLQYDANAAPEHTVEFGKITKDYATYIQYNVFSGTYSDKPVSVVKFGTRAWSQKFDNAHPIWNKINHKLPVKIIACDRSGTGYGGEIVIITEPLGKPLWKDFPTDLNRKERIKIAEDLANDLKKIQALDKGYETLYPGSIYFTKSENSVKGTLFYFSDNIVGAMETAYRMCLEYPKGFSFDRAALAAPEHFTDGLRKDNGLTKANIFTFGTILWSIFQGHLPKPEEIPAEKVQEGFTPVPERDGFATDPEDDLDEIASELKAREHYYQVNKMIDRIMDSWQNLEMPTDCPVAIQQLIKKCWSEKPEDRPSIDEVIDVLHTARLPYSLVEDLKQIK